MATKELEPKKIDKEVIKRAQKGSKKDFLVIYEYYSPKVYRYCLYKVRSPEDAEDVASECWMNIVKSLKNFKFDSSFNTWIYSVVKNIVAQYYRNLYANSTDTYEEWMEEDNKIKSTNKSFDHDIDETVTGEKVEDIFKDNEVEEDKINKEEKVKEALLKLKPQHAKLIELRFLKGYKIKEVASELKISVNNAKIIQLRAIRKLKDIYSKENNDKSKE